jgi:radical SAM superfamily enzyme YgiQ (UPF0313 family)
MKIMDLLLLTAIDPFSYQIQPDLGLMYVAGAARAAGFSVDIQDCRKERWDYKRLEEQVQESRPAVVGIKSFSNEAGRVARMAETVRRALPEAVIIVGGPHPSMDPEGTLERMKAADYAFVGEAERSLPRFLGWVQSGRRGPLPPEIKGVAFRDNGRVVVRPAEWEDDLDSLPFPAWDLMPPTSYPNEVIGLFAPAFPAAPILLSRGCPYRCTYCGASRIAGRRFRYRSVENALEEIAFLEEHYGIRTFALVDNSFTSHRRHAMEFFQALLARPKKIFFTFPNGVRADSLDEELLRTMEGAGCGLIGLGIESSSDETLKRMKKDQTAALVEEKVNLIRRTTSIPITGSFVLGYPGETLEDVKRTIRFAVKLPVHHAHFCVFIPLPGSEVYRELIERGQFCPADLDPEGLTNDRSSFSLPGLPIKRLVRLHQYAYLRFYLTPWRLLYFFTQIKTLSHLRVILRIILKVFL